MASAQNIWDYLQSLHYSVVARTEKKTVPLVLESAKLNNSQSERMESSGLAMEKLDGVYSFITILNTSYGIEVRHWGRTGKALSNCEDLDLRIAGALGSTTKGLVVISEITSEDPLAKLSGYLNPNRVKGSSFVPTNKKDNVHDIVTLEEFISGVSNEPFYVRRDLVERLFDDTTIDVIDGEHMTLDEAYEWADDVWGDGGEGLIFAQSQGTWIAGKRDETKIKIKEKLSYDVTVVGMASGVADSKYETTLGKLYVVFRAFGKDNGVPLVVPISGMTDAQRNFWWKNPEEILGRIVKMDAKSFTEEGNLREPRFKEVRNDKAESDFPVVIDMERSECTYKAKASHTIQNWSLK